MKAFGKALPNSLAQYTSFGLWKTWKRYILFQAGCWRYSGIMRAILPWLQWVWKNWWFVLIFPKYVHGKKFEGASVLPIGKDQKRSCIRRCCPNWKRGWMLALWHPSVLFGLTSKSGKCWRNWGKMLQLKISVFAVNSRYGVFWANEVPKIGSEGEKRNWPASKWKKNCAADSDGFRGTVKLNFMKNFLLSFAKIAFEFSKNSFFSETTEVFPVIF